MGALPNLFDLMQRCDENGVLLVAPRPRKPLILRTTWGQRHRRTYSTEERAAAMARYQLDHEAISNHPDMIGITEDLVAAVSDPGWNREKECKRCYDWDAGSLLTRPRPPRAEDASDGCAGCTWSYIDGLDPDLLREAVRLDRLKQLAESWAKQLTTWRGQSVARVWCAAKKRFVEVAENSSYRRWAAKLRELKACRKLIAQLDGRARARVQGDQPQGIQAHRRALSRRMDFVRNLPAA